MKNILCIGGNGALGKSVLKYLNPYSLTNIDFSASSLTQSNFLLEASKNPQDNNKSALQFIKNKKQQYDAIIVTAGGWSGGSIKDEDYFEKCENMFNVNVVPSLLAAHLAMHYLSKSGLLLFTGAAAVFKQPQPEMIAYSMAKTGVHSLALNIT